MAVDHTAGDEKHQMVNIPKKVGKSNAFQAVSHAIRNEYGIFPGNRTDIMVSECVIELLIQNNLLDINDIAKKALEIAPRFGFHK